MTRNGIPQSTKKLGAGVRKTDASQNTAKPAQRKLNGIMNASDARKTIPWRGAPDHSWRSPRSSSNGLTAIDVTRAHAGLRSGRFWPLEPGRASLAGDRRDGYPVL